METSVVYAGTYGNGDIYVIVTDTIPEPGCTAARFDVAASEPDAKNVLAIAYLAMLSGEKIRVDTNGCYNGYATLDNSGNSGLQLLGPGQ